MKEAMVAKEALRLSVIRGLLSAFTNEAVAKGRQPDAELLDEEVLDIVRKQAKQRKDSIEQFEKGGRPELAESEKEELAILEVYLPAQMSREDVVQFVEQKRSETEVSAESKGQFMGLVMKELKGKADGGMVKEVVDSLF